MTSFLRKFIVGQAERERESARERTDKGEKRDPLFLILLSTLMSSTLEVQEHYSLTVKDISRSLSLFRSFTFVYCSVFNAFAAFRSVCDEKRKGIISSCFLNIHIYIRWPCSVLFFPSIIIITIIIMHPVYLSRRRQTEKRRVRNGI